MGRGRPKLRTAEEAAIIKEINSLRSRLVGRVNYTESKGLANQFTSEARTIDMSVKGKSLSQLKKVRREIKHQLSIRSTTISGAKDLEHATRYVSKVMQLPKRSRERVYHLMNKAMERYVTLKEKRFRYKLEDIVVDLVTQKRKNKTILTKLEEIASATSYEGDAGFDRERESILNDFDLDDYF